MTPTISDQQRMALGAGQGNAAVPVVDPVENRTYYLVPAEMFERLCEDAAGGDALEAVYPLMDQVAKNEGWDDPEMDAYDQLDPRKQS